MHLVLSRLLHTQEQVSVLQQLQAADCGHNKGAHCCATSRVQRMNRPSAIFMMLALCTAVTRLRPLSAAYLNAYSATRLLATRVMICRLASKAGLHRVDIRTPRTHGSQALPHATCTYFTGCSTTETRSCLVKGTGSDATSDQRLVQCCSACWVLTGARSSYISLHVDLEKTGYMCRGPPLATTSSVCTGSLPST